MLILTREKCQDIWIGDNIRIVVVEIRGHKVRIGIDAPADVPVHRGEVRDAIRRHSQAAEHNANVVVDADNHLPTPGVPLHVVPLAAVAEIRSLIWTRRNAITRESGPAIEANARLDEINSALVLIDGLIAGAKR